MPRFCRTYLARLAPLIALAAAALLAAFAVACSDAEAPAAPPEPTATPTPTVAAEPSTLVVLTHDSFDVNDGPIEAFQRQHNATVELMKILARACGHEHLSRFSMRDLTTWKRDMADLTGVRYAGVG